MPDETTDWRKIRSTLTVKDWVHAVRTRVECIQDITFEEAMLIVPEEKREEVRKAFYPDKT
jgi:hypothetical protein